MLDDAIGAEASYLRRLGALSATLCGVAAVLGAGLSLAQPCAENLLAAVGAAALALAGAALARRS